MPVAPSCWLLVLGRPGAVRNVAWHWGSEGVLYSGDDQLRADWRYGTAHASVNVASLLPRCWLRHYEHIGKAIAQLHSMFSCHHLLS